MRLLVTGGRTTVGAAVAAAAARLGHAVTTLEDAMGDESVDLVSAPAHRLMAAVDGVDCVIHTATAPSGASREADAVDVRGTSRLVQACVGGVSRLVLVSTTVGPRTAASAEAVVAAADRFGLVSTAWLRSSDPAAVAEEAVELAANGATPTRAPESSQGPRVDDATSPACFVAAIPESIDAFLVPYIDAVAPRPVHLVAERRGRAAGSWHLVPIPRDIAPLRDLRALVALIRTFRRLRPGMVHSLTPKAGLLASVAARVARVPVRVHSFTGQVWATRSGTSRRILRWADCVTARNTTHQLVDGYAQRAFLVEERVLPPGAGRVLGFGTFGGAALPPTDWTTATRGSERAARGLTADEVLVLFVGRLHREKGLHELAEAFRRALPDAPHLRLLIAGPDEGGIAGELERILDGVAEAEVRPTFVEEPRRLMAAADIFCLPSHREAFGAVVVEAATVGTPSIVSDVYGLEDTVVPEVTGTNVPVRDPAALAEALVALGTDAARRRAMGAAARRRAAVLYAPESFAREIRAFYGELSPPR